MLRQVNDRISPDSPAAPAAAAQPPGDGDAASVPLLRRWARKARSQVGRRLAVILLVWLASLGMSLFVDPNYDHFSTVELVYYSVYNVAVGALVGFYLLDRVSRGGVAAFLWKSITLIVAGTLINETFVEPIAFQTGPINFEGVYYGLAEAITAAGIFLLLGLTDHFLVARQRADAAQAASLPTGPGEGACFFVRVGGGETRRIFVADLIYMEAEKDFTRVVCANGEHFVSESMKNLLERVPPQEVVRIHKSFAVNLRRAERLSRTEVSLGDRSLPVGRTYWKAFAESWKAH
jgi:LytTr DNA-binding domain